MRDIPTPIPDSLGRRFEQWRGQPWFDAVWQLLVIAVAVVLAGVLISLGSAGVVLGFLIVAFFFRDPIQDAFSDIWERDFWRFP